MNFLVALIQDTSAMMHNHLPYSLKKSNHKSWAFYKLLLPIRKHYKNDRVAVHLGLLLGYIFVLKWEMNFNSSHLKNIKAFTTTST